MYYYKGISLTVKVKSLIFEKCSWILKYLNVYYFPHDLKPIWTFVGALEDGEIQVHDKALWNASNHAGVK